MHQHELFLLRRPLYFFGVLDAQRSVDLETIPMALRST
jgi:hypothetical protein